MGGWAVPTFIVIQVAVHAIRIDSTVPKYFIASPSQENQHQQLANQEAPANHNELQSSSFYSFQSNTDDGTHLDLNPNFKYQIYHFNDNRNDFLDKGQETPNNDVVDPSVHQASQDYAQNQFLSQPIDYQAFKHSVNEPARVSLPKDVPTNSHFLGYTVQSPFSSTTSYYSSAPRVETPDVKLPKKYNVKLHEGYNAAPHTQTGYTLKKYIPENYVKISPKYTSTDIAAKTEGTYRILSNFDDSIYRQQSPKEGLSSGHTDPSRTVYQTFSPDIRDLIAKAHYLGQEKQQALVGKYRINRKDSALQPSENYEVRHEGYGDEHEGYSNDDHQGDHGSKYQSFHHEAKKKKKEIHYHQHKHLHEHDHDQKHTHKHQAGHHHDHGHDHEQKHAHSHSHKNDHWHDHHEKNKHKHDHDHWHDHHGLHDHKHHEDHGHKHNSDHHHDHEAHHDHHEDHKNDHGHKHHEDHKHKHGHDHKHDGKHHHDHHQSHKHGHKHHHKHVGKH